MALVQLDRPWGTIVDDDGGAADNEFHVSAKKFQVAAGMMLQQSNNYRLPSSSNHRLCNWVRPADHMLAAF